MFLGIGLKLGALGGAVSFDGDALFDSTGEPLFDSLSVRLVAQSA